MKTKFYLRKGTQNSTIYFEFRNGEKTKFRASTGFILRNEKEWDSVKQKIKLQTVHPSVLLVIIDYWVSLDLDELAIL